MTRFMEKVLLAPSIADAHKKLIAESELIIADNVADYYFRISDQEIWSYQTDFPNSAPPFGQFFVECRAPKQIVSRVHGVQSWPPWGASEWGVLCTGTDSAQRIAATRSEEGRRALRFEVDYELQRLWNTIVSFLPSASLSALEDANSAKMERDADRKLMIESFLHRRGISQHMRDGRWEEIRTALVRQEHRWTLDLTLFVNVPRSGKEYIWGPIWHLRLYVKSDGRIVLTPNNQALLMEEGLGEIAQRMECTQRTAGGNIIDVFNEVHQEFTPLLHVAMLTVSFLHCKNVRLQTKASSPKPLSNKQRRRGDRPRPRITYHILNIEPLKEILRTEGKEGHNGTKRALHICRGYFANYQEGRGLFGKYHGVYWFDQKVRGTSEQGISLKDYQVRP